MRLFGTVPLRTEHLELRRYKAEDALALYTFSKRPEMFRYITFKPCATLPGAKEFIEMNMYQYQHDQSFFGWAITVDDQIIGSIGCYNMDTENESCEIGYNVSSDYWGKGYATESTKAVLRYLFETIQIHKVCASVHVENQASMKVLEKCGMTYEGNARETFKEKDGSFSDTYYYGITRGEYMG